mmetsp:Transcript_15862/g.55186  ORF Transcript_15862/g.55186 Transcript_15862/m.55186 type:complete len:251 (+) Transcript_15862:37-789(+)
MIDCFSDALWVATARCLEPLALGRLRAAGRGVAADLSTHARVIIDEVLTTSVPDPLARLHYEEMFGSCVPGILLRRRWLLEIDSATQHHQWRAESSVARLMQGVNLDGGDFFCSLRRAYLAAQVPSLAKSVVVVHWMHILGAVEEQDPVQAKWMSQQAWREVASSITAETVLWCVQSAHFIDDLSGLPFWLVVGGEDGRGGPTRSLLLAWLESLVCKLESRPALGKYGPEGNSSQVRARHLSKVMAELRA